MPILAGSVPLTLPGGEEQVVRRRPRRYASSYGGTEGQSASPTAPLVKRQRGGHKMAYALHDDRTARRSSRLAYEDTGM